MSDTPRNDSAEERGDDVYRDPTAPSDAPSYGPPSPAGSSEHTEHTEQLPTGGDTQQVPTSSSVPPPPPAPPGGGSAAQNPYAAPSSGDAPQNPYASPPEGAAPQNPYASPPAGEAYPTQDYPGQDHPSQDQVAAQYGAAGTPPPPGYGQAPAYGQPAYGQAPYGNPGGSLSGNTIALLIVTGLLTVVGCGVGIPGLIFAIIAVTKKDQPSEMAKWTRWGWIALGATLVLVVLAIVLFAVLLAAGGSTSP